MRTVTRMVGAVFFAVVALGGPGSAWAESADSQQFVVIYAGPVDHRPGTVVAGGAINDVGMTGAAAVEREPDGTFVTHTSFIFSGGTLLVTLRYTEQFSFDPSICVARYSQAGTFEITGGLDSYQGATGQGTFAGQGVAVAPRGADGCLRTGVVEAFAPRFEGALALPGGEG